MSNIIVYLAVDKDGGEWIYPEVPKRNNYLFIWADPSKFSNEIQIPHGTIKKLTGKDITWESGYIEYVGDNYDPTIE